MELIGRKAGDLSANCQPRDVHSAGIRQLIYPRPPVRLPDRLLDVDVDVPSGRDHQVEG